MAQNILIIHREFLGVPQGVLGEGVPESGAVAGAELIADGHAVHPSSVGRRSYIWRLHGKARGCLGRSALLNLSEIIRQAASKRFQVAEATP